MLPVTLAANYYYHQLLLAHQFVMQLAVLLLILAGLEAWCSGMCGV